MRNFPLHCLGWYSTCRVSPHKKIGNKLVLKTQPPNLPDLHIATAGAYGIAATGRQIDGYFWDGSPVQVQGGVNEVLMGFVSCSFDLRGWACYFGRPSWDSFFGELFMAVQGLRPLNVACPEMILIRVKNKAWLWGKWWWSTFFLKCIFSREKGEVISCGWRTHLDQNDQHDVWCQVNLCILSIYIYIYTCNISRYTCHKGQDTCRWRFFFSPGLALEGGHHRYHGWIQRSCAIYFPGGIYWYILGPAQTLQRGDNILPKTNSSPQIDGWETILSFWDSAHFQGRTVREGTLQRTNISRLKVALKVAGKMIFLFHRWDMWSFPGG